MLRPLSRRLFAVLSAILVICAIGGAPVAAMTSDDAGLTDDGLTAGFESPEGSDSEDDGDDSEDTTDDEDGEETEDEESNDTDGEDDAETDGEESNDTDGEDDAETDGEESDDTDGEDDGATADDGPDDAGDADTEDDAGDGETDDADSDSESRTYTDRVLNESETVDGDDAVTEDLAEGTESLLKANEDDDELIGPVDGLEAGSDEVDDLTDEEVVSTDSVDVRTLTLSVGDLEFAILTYEDPAYGAAPGSADRSALEVTDSSAHLRAAIATHDGGLEDDRGVVFESGDDAGEGDEPLPPAPGGAAVALGTLAAAAAVRSSPFVATEGARAASSTGTSLLSSLLEKVRPFVFPLRYSRYDDSDPLEHEAREQVYAIVNEEPGSYLSEVSEEADLPLSTTRHHIKILEREDLVSGAKLRGKRRFYPAYSEGIELAAALNDDSTATIIDALSRFGAASVSDLADELERDPSTISHHLQRLEEDDIVTRERDGRAVVTRLSSDARTALEPESAPRPPEAEEALAGGAD